MKDVIASSYGNCLTARVTTKIDWEAAKVLGTPDQEVNVVESEEGANVPKMVNYFIPSKIPEELVLMTSLVHSDLLLRMYSKLWLACVYDT